MNIGSPIPDPRLQLTADLNAQIDQFFAAGKRPVRLGDDGVLALGVLGVVMKDPHPVPGALQLMRLGRVGK